MPSGSTSAAPCVQELEQLGYAQAEQELEQLGYAQAEQPAASCGTSSSLRPSGEDARAVLRGVEQFAAQRRSRDST